MCNIFVPQSNLSALVTGPAPAARTCITPRLTPNRLILILMIVGEFQTIVGDYQPIVGDFQLIVGDFQPIVGDFSRMAQNIIYNL